MKKERYEEQLCEELLTADDIAERLINNQTQTPSEACVACSYALAKLTSNWDTRLDVKILSGWWERFKFVHPSNPKDDCLLLKPKLALIAASHRNQMKDFFPIVNLLLEKIENRKDYFKLKTFLESFFSYHISLS